MARDLQVGDVMELMGVSEYMKAVDGFWNRYGDIVSNSDKEKVLCDSARVEGMRIVDMVFCGSKDLPWCHLHSVGERYSKIQFMINGRICGRTHYVPNEALY